MLLRRRPLARGPGRRRRGEPRVRRPAAPPQTPNPSRKEDSCFDDSSSWPASSLLACALAAPALAVRVKVRVEGKTTTIFGATAADARRAGANALDGARGGEHRRRVLLPRRRPRSARSSTRSAATRAPASAAGATRSTASRRRSAPTRRTLKDGDTVLWYWATFAEQGGPPTLLLTPRASANCYRSLSQNDQGSRDSGGSARVLVVDGRSVKTRAGRGCVGKHRGLVRATLPGRGALERAQVKRALSSSPSRSSCSPAAGTSAQARGAPRSGSRATAERPCSLVRRCRPG